VRLVHVGAFDAEMIPRLLQLYRDPGLEFLTWPDAEGEAFYRSALDPHLPAGADTLEAL
jgi:peptidoglycan-N-acetylglucosamine deacetylase